MEHHIMARITKPFPYSIEQLEATFTLDAENGKLIRQGAGRVSTTQQSTKSKYRRVSINGVDYSEHRIIWMMCNRQPIPIGMEIDHINRDKHDNRASNLRLVTRNQNGANRGMLKNNSVGFKGVYRAGGRLRAEIMICGIKHRLGYFANAEAAARAYDLAATSALGGHALTNAALGLLPAY
jgi:hypothetical protein